ncbi:LppA family lipoprotein [Qaidamihabitans albus]|uniref:LppA family lipoprotein n=1 Tax=Qaidamihabitans albus TaxID=2795733 RepID=UPI001F2B1C56|nr:LppA family lipoprotein [Qaidamihabitans albus]
MTLRQAMATLMVALALTVAGCGSDPSKDANMNTLFTELMQRPDIQTAEADYQDLLARIRDKLVADIGIERWTQDGEPVSGSACVGQYAKLGADGEIRRYSSGTSPGNIADADWPRAVEVVADLAGRHGFGEPQVVVDRPGDHEVSLKDEYGAELLFGTAVNTTLSLSTGCHLTREAHQRGIPAEEAPLY